MHWHQKRAVDDPVLERLVELYKKLDAAKGGSVIKGSLRFDSSRWVIASKTVDRTYRTNDFELVGEWKKAAEYLELENEFRSLLFSDLTPKQMDAYRTSVGLPPATRQKTDAQ